MNTTFMMVIFLGVVRKSFMHFQLEPEKSFALPFLLEKHWCAIEVHSESIVVLGFSNPSS